MLYLGDYHRKWRLNSYSHGASNSLKWKGAKRKYVYVIVKDYRCCTKGAKN